MTALLEKVRGLLQGEPLRLIVYGAAVVVWLVSRIAPAIAEALGSPLELQPIGLDQALLMATGASIALTETVRRFVYSPATVNAIVQTPPTSAGPIAAAEAAGVDTSQPVEDPTDLDLDPDPDLEVDTPAVVDESIEVEL